MTDLTQKTVLVSGASGVVGYGILRSLKNSGLNCRLIGTTIYDDSVAPAFCDIFELAPKTDNDGYIGWLCAVIKKHRVDMIIPAIEADMIKWNDNREILTKTGTFVLLNNESLIRLCADKWHFFEKMSENCPEWAIPSRLDDDFDDIVQNFGLPFLMKPRRGFAARGISQIRTREEFENVKKICGDTVMAQPIVGTTDEEYTVSAFFDKQSSLLAFQQMKRKLAKEGYTGHAEVSHLPDMKNVLEKLADVFKPVGPTNFQFRQDGGKLKVLEINPRVSSATSVRTAFGYNESKMSVEYFLNGLLPTQPVVKEGFAVRYIEDFIFQK